MARGTERAPDALTVSSDSRCLAFVGPSEYTVTVADARTLDEVNSHTVQSALFTLSIRVWVLLSHPVHTDT